MIVSLSIVKMETGFVYLRGRYYDPATERFITEEPMKDGGNWYGYCGNAPANNVDPSGLKKTTVSVTLPGGKKVNATVENGITRMANGQRPPSGAISNT